MTIDIRALADEHGDMPVEAYLLIFQGLDVTQRSSSGHVSGPDLVSGCVTFVQESWGVMGAMVLRQFGIGSSGDIGKLVWRLTDAGIIQRQDTDSLSDFDIAPDADPVRMYDATYPWNLSALHATTL